jgi:hypothetical protein
VAHVVALPITAHKMKFAFIFDWVFELISSICAPLSLSAAGLQVKIKSVTAG